MHYVFEQQFKRSTIFKLLILLVMLRDAKKVGAKKVGCKMGEIRPPRGNGPKNWYPGGISRTRGDFLLSSPNPETPGG